MSPLKKLADCGQAPWLDFLSRSLLASGKLARLIEEDGVTGLTSNPSIFAKAIGESGEYDADLRKLAADGKLDAGQIYEQLAIADIRAAADTLRPVYERSHGADGYVSLEVSPHLAHDSKGTVEEARRLWRAVGRDNLMIKVPGTPAGMPAIRTLIAEGINVNITLLFAVSAYEQVVEAFLAGLEDRQRAGGQIANVASVASFFVSRIDSAVDKQLDALAKSGGDAKLIDGLRGTAAIANAKDAYQRAKKLFSGTRWAALKEYGARPQRLLWASTSTKNPKYRDTIYVEALIGRDTVNTLPPATVDAFRDHGQVVPDAIEHEIEQARTQLAQLDQLGISLDAVTAQLVEEGVKLFAEAFDQLMASVAARRKAA